MDRGGEDALVLELPVTEALIDLIVARVTEALRDELIPGDDGWLDANAAARHLSCPRSRIYALVHQREIPYSKDGARLLFRREELDAWVRSGGARRQ